MAAKHLLSEECSIALNHMHSYELHISDAYLSTRGLMACYYIEGPGEPLFATFFENQAEVKRELGKQFLKYLRGCESKICLPVIKRPEIDNWGTGRRALESALELENHLSKLLLDLETIASANNEYDVLCFMGKYLEEQKSTNYLPCQLRYHKELENQA
ncbi:ferritin, heavy subunit-like [Eptesicus fuscus]|uniref:ferritin, heavy subunit-like n=1 Tax=Eptesicus fuscus TaxID=29078 RepID=UPI002403D8FF|nr:ferritin, heavy subunit-like [Eptesicus fuscus]